MTSQSIPGSDRLPTFRYWLEGLLDLFPEDLEMFAGRAFVPDREVPEPYRSLLVHRHHMTVTLEEHHGRPVALEPRRVRREGTDYSRSLLLRSGPGGPVVMAGIMRISLQYCSNRVAAAILEERTPLGRILIENRVMRRIQAEAFLRFELDRGLRSLFGAPGATDHTYGRLAGILCNRLPAIELLEVVRPHPRPETSP